MGRVCGKDYWGYESFIDMGIVDHSQGVEGI
jgi:hypothetical protein